VSRLAGQEVRGYFLQHLQRTSPFSAQLPGVAGGCAGGGGHMTEQIAGNLPAVGGGSLLSLPPALDHSSGLTA